MNELLSAIDSLPVGRKIARHGTADWRIVRGDCIEVLKELPERSVSLIFADPPYNLQLKNPLYRPNFTRVDGVDDSWDKFESFAAYDKFCEDWLRECRRVLSDDGAIWVIGTYHNIGRLSRLLQDMDFWLQNDVLWKKTNPIPNFRGVRFTNATETLLWAKKHEKGRAIFNHWTMKHENGGKQMTNVWEFPVCGGAERLRDASGKKLHPTQKPLALLRRLILATTRRGDVVLDPFLGSGTTVAAARMLGRIGVGIEREAKYVKIAIKSISKVEIDLNVVERDANSTLSQVKFPYLIEHGYVKARERLYTKRSDMFATIMRDGNVKINGEINFSGSIHRAGAMAAGTDVCNGWKFWFVKRDGELHILDDIRKEARNEKPE